jgi:hypothetical protein
MTRCERIQSCLSALVDDELPQAEVVPALDHVARCAACRGFYRDVRAFDALLEADPRFPGRAPARSRGPQRPLNLAPLLAAAAMLVIGVGLGIAAARMSGRTDDAPAMTDERFVGLAAEVLQADGRYQEEMLDVLTRAARQREVREGPFEGRRRIPDRRGASPRAAEAHRVRELAAATGGAQL